MKNIVLIASICFSLFTTANANDVGAAYPFDLGLSLLWESRYVSEGRDNLDGDGLASIEASAGYLGFELGAWAAESPDQDYTEYNYWIGYSYEWDALTLGVAYTYLDFETDDADDHEYSADLAYSFGDRFEFAFGAYYSDESDGAFYEMTLSKEFEFCDGLSILPFSSVGYNDGYIVDGHDGWNHLTLGLELSYAFLDQVSLGAFLAGNIEIDSDKDRYGDDELLEDFVYGGLSVSILY